MTGLITKIKRYRDKYNMTQKELADRVHVRRETIVRLEQGKYNPSLKLAADIAKVFDTTIENIFSYEDQEKTASDSTEKE
ncbi:MAG TPA: helix-turn-helix transcriptional regulator [Candidatus Mediterraneibacter norwichensis]|nr:helix-turn-helix transcriptional regulator [Candidatus Mediterraneibacter norwichensis]